MKITVVGAGYVGLSVATLLSSAHDVLALDTNKTVVESINERRTTIRDTDIESWFSEKTLTLQATTDRETALAFGDVIILALPTNYDPETQHFELSSINSTLELLASVNPNAIIVVKSTVPVGFTSEAQACYGLKRLIFSPEFLREGSALHDNLYPSRIIVGSDGSAAEKGGRVFGEMISEAAHADDVAVLYMRPTEAEAVKLFSNSYLAMRVAFFNELDTFAELRGLDARSIVDGVSLDPRIGTFYNNPSFGFGGYCLPKDSKQLVASYGDIRQELFSAVISSNVARFDHIARQVVDRLADLGMPDPVVGIYRVNAKMNSDNSRFSTIQEIMSRLSEVGVEQIVYEPNVHGATLFNGYRVVNDLDEFMRCSNLILANRYSSDLDSVRDLVYTRDLFARD